MGRKKINILIKLNKYINIEEEKTKIEKLNKFFFKNNGYINYSKKLMFNGLYPCFLL